jgi:hypothetical protein
MLTIVVYVFIVVNVVSIVYLNVALIQRFVDIPAIRHKIWHYKTRHFHRF